MANRTVSIKTASHTTRAWSERGSLSICPTKIAPKEPALDTDLWEMKAHGCLGKIKITKQYTIQTYGLTVFESPDSSEPSAEGLNTVYMFALLPVIS